MTPKKIVVPVVAIDLTKTSVPVFAIDLTKPE
jgi:hypothetical protein